MSNTLFHNKFHLTNHHTVSTYGYPDSGIDPIASQTFPFLGIFYNKFTTNFQSITSNSFDWYSAYTTLKSNSATYYLYPTTYQAVLSGINKWNSGFSFYTSYKPNSAACISVYTTISGLSAGWPFLETAMRTNLFQEYTTSKNFAGVTLYPTIYPAILYFNYASLNGATDYLLPSNTYYTVLRNSSATYTDSQGFVKYSPPTPRNPARLDYQFNDDIQEWEPQGLLIEEARTNYLLFSNNFDVGVWGKSAQTAVFPAPPYPYGGPWPGVPDPSSPDNNSYADYVFLGPEPEGLNYTVNGTPGDRYEPSFYVNPNYSTAIPGYPPSGVAILHNLEGNDYGYWAIDFSKLRYLNWNRITSFHKAVSVQKDFVIGPGGTCQLALYDANATFPEPPRLEFWLWGFQLEQGNFSTSLIPTSGIIQSRTTEYAVLSGNGICKNSEGTFLVETKLLGSSADHNMSVFRFFDESKITGIYARYNKNNYTSSAQGLINNSPALAFTFNSNVNDNKCIRTFALSYIRNNIVYVDTGKLVGIDASSLVPSNLSSCYIGISAGNDSSYNGYIRRFGFYPKQFDNNTLRLLTLSSVPFTSYDMIHAYDWSLSSSQVAFVSLSTTSVIHNPVNTSNIKKGGEYIMVINQDPLGDHQLVFDDKFIMPKNIPTDEVISLSSQSITVIRFISNGTKLFGKPTKYYYWLNDGYTYYGKDGIRVNPNPVGLYEEDVIYPAAGSGAEVVGGVPYYNGGGLTIIYDGV